MCEEVDNHFILDAKRMKQDDRSDLFDFFNQSSLGSRHVSCLIPSPKQSDPDLVFNYNYVGTRSEAKLNLGNKSGPSRLRAGPKLADISRVFNLYMAQKACL